MTKPLEVGICGWAVDRHDPIRAIETAGGQLDARVVQIGFFGSSALDSADAEAIQAAANKANVALVGAFVAFDGEDYASIERIAATGGYAPDATYPARLAATVKAAALTARFNAPALAVHAATIPDDSNSALYKTLVDRVREVADAVSAEGVRLLLETGRESSDTLAAFLDAVDHDGVGVNFDVGNFILYGTDEPAKAIAKLKGRIEIVHLKDASRSTKPGVAFGQYQPLGSGDVQIARVISKLKVAGYAGPLLVERATADGDADALSGAIGYVRSMLA